MQPRPFLWVAFPSMLGGYAKIAELAARLGFAGVAPRAGQGLPNGSYRADPTFTEKDCRTLLDSGLECHPWFYSYPQAVKVESQEAIKLQSWGASSVIIDAEAPWDMAKDAKDRATEFGDLLVPYMSVPVYDAPWPWIDYHPGYPEKEFRWVDGRLIQAYWTEIGVSARHCLDKARDQWKGKDLDRVYPIGVTYGRDELARWKVQQLPPGRFDTVEALAVASEVTGGWYSAEASADGFLEALASARGALSGLACTPSNPFACAVETLEDWRSRIGFSGGI